MLAVLIVCTTLLGLTVLLHYEALCLLNARLAGMKVPHRTKMLVVIFSTFAAHAVEILLYGIGIYFLLNYFEVGSLSGPEGNSFAICLYFSAEAFSSLGLGDVVPFGPIRLLGGFEALNGLLLIAWSASYTYLAMERFWSDPVKHRPR